MDLILLHKYLIPSKALMNLYLAPKPSKSPTLLSIGVTCIASELRQVWYQASLQIKFHDGLPEWPPLSWSYPQVLVPLPRGLADMAIQETFSLVSIAPGLDSWTPSQLSHPSLVGWPLIFFFGIVYNKLTYTRPFPLVSWILISCLAMVVLTNNLSHSSTPIGILLGQKSSQICPTNRLSPRAVVIYQDFTAAFTLAPLRCKVVEHACMSPQPQQLYRSNTHSASWNQLYTYKWWLLRFPLTRTNCSQTPILRMHSLHLRWPMYELNSYYILLYQPLLSSAWPISPPQNPWHCTLCWSYWSRQTLNIKEIPWTVTSQK